MITEITLWILSISLLLLVLVLNEKKLKKKIKYISTFILLPLIIMSIITISTLVKADNNIKTLTIDIIDYEIIEIPTRGTYSYIVAYSTINDLEVLDVDELEINYNSDKSDITIFEKDIPNKLKEEAKVKVVINTVKDESGEELEFITNINKW